MLFLTGFYPGQNARHFGLVRFGVFYCISGKATNLSKFVQRSVLQAKCELRCCDQISDSDSVSLEKPGESCPLTPHMPTIHMSSDPIACKAPAKGNSLAGTNTQTPYMILESTRIQQNARRLKKTANTGEDLGSSMYFTTDKYIVQA